MKVLAFDVREDSLIADVLQTTVANMHAFAARQPVHVVAGPEPGAQ